GGRSFLSSTHWCGQSTSGISPSFPGLSRSSRQVTHVLLTRSRLCPRPKPGSSLHLHVLGTPPAFVLSQDQTLRKRLSWFQPRQPRPGGSHCLQEVVKSEWVAHRVHRGEPRT